MSSRKTKNDVSKLEGEEGVFKKDEDIKTFKRNHFVHWDSTLEKCT